MPEDAPPAGTATPALKGPRAAIIISALISLALIYSNIRSFMGPPTTMINVDVPWLGLTEAGTILLVMRPAWRGQLWAVTVQAAVLLLVALHSYWLLSTDRWMSGGGNFVDGNAALWRTGFGEAYLVVMLPYFFVIVSEATFIIRQLTGRKRTPTRTPIWLRVTVAITGLIAVDMIGLLIGPFWQGFPEGVVLLALLWPAWNGRLWAVSAQAAVLLISVFHSYAYYSQLNPLSDPAGHRLVFLAPVLFILILFDAIFVLPQLQSKRLPTHRTVTH
ncbi:hypothetical protein [Pseudarthrobacter sp. NPDC080039]|uniref:hypothetical protein n=1 Tax=unclassified Pseudarthrobacter TaxID=2647000 RepID=UPI00344F94B5